MSDFYLAGTLRQTLPSLAMDDHIAQHLREILAMPRVLHSLLLQEIKLSTGDLFLTLPHGTDLAGANLKQGRHASRRSSIAIIEAIALQFVAVPGRSALLDNALGKRTDAANAQYDYQSQLVTLEDDLLYCLDNANPTEDEVASWAWWGLSGFYSIGVFIDGSARQPTEPRISVTSLQESIARAQGVIFSVFDSEAFAIWCPTA